VTVQCPRSDAHVTVDTNRFCYFNSSLPENWVPVCE